MNVRLTNATRDHIASAAIAAAFNPRRAELDQAEDALAREAYAAVFSADEIKKAKAMPKNWLRHDPCLNFNVAGLRIELCTTADHLPVPYQNKNGDHGYSCHHSQGVIEAGELADRITAHATAKENLRDEKRQTRRKLDAMLASISTIKKLEEAWPEGKPFYERFAEKAAPLPPAIRVSDINAALGLPAHIAAAELERGRK